MFSATSVLVSLNVVCQYILPVGDNLFKVNLENVKKSRFEMKKVWRR